jgi:hypothetical protein
LRGEDSISTSRAVPEASRVASDIPFSKENLTHICNTNNKHRFIIRQF